MKRNIFAILIAAAGILAAAIMPASAADNGRKCLKEQVVRTGGTADTEIFARKRARDAWRQKVEEQHGKKYSAWYLAKGHEYSCFPQDGKTRCTAKATPCESAVVVQGPRKICNFYRIDATGEAATIQQWAMHKARAKWSTRANMLVGDDFDTWLLANNRKVECEKNSDGAYVCKAMATPCRFSVIN